MSQVNGASAASVGSAGAVCFVLFLSLGVLTGSPPLYLAAILVIWVVVMVNKIFK